MTNRAMFDIIYDLLKVMEGRCITTPPKILFQRAKVSGLYQQQKYMEILEMSKLVDVYGEAPNKMLDITTKGEKFIIFYDAIQELLR